MAYILSGRLRFTIIFFLILVCGRLSAQQIALKQLVSFLGKDADQIANFLQLQGFEFESKDHPIMDSSTDNMYFISKSKTARFKINREGTFPHFLNSIDYVFYNKKEYNDILRLLLTDKFTKVSSESGSYWIAEEFSYIVEPSTKKVAYISLNNDRLLNKHNFAPYSLFISFDKLLKQN